MAQAKTVPFSKWLLQLGDGGGPETFAAPCGLTSRGLSLSGNANEVIVPDCANEDAPAWVQREFESFSGSISGSGVVDEDSYDDWRTFFLSGVSKNVRMKLDRPLANGGGYWAGAFKLTSFNTTGERGQKVSVEVTLDSDGPVTWVAASA